MADTQSSQDDASKYAHLLQPIRDLAANWDINLASELEEYLEVLENITFSFGHGGPSLNFAEAALVIQGSACVYGKKVEHLHKLVYQALEFLASEKRTKASRSNSQAAGDASDGDSDNGEQFLNLDDNLEVGTDLDLNENAVQVPAHAVRLPASLAAWDDLGQAQGEEAGNFRIAQCFVHSSGALLLEQNDGQLLNDRLQQNSSSNTQAAASLSSIPAQPPRQSDQVVATAAAVEAASPATECERGGQWDDDTDCAGCLEDEYDGLDANGGQRASTAGPQEEDVGTAEPALGFDAYDPYKQMDPHSRGTLALKPYRKSRRKIDWQLAAARSKTSLDDDMWFTVPQALPKGLAYPEFLYALRQPVKAHRRSHRDGDAMAATRHHAHTMTQSAFTAEDPGAAAVLTEGVDDDDDGEDVAEMGCSFDNDAGQDDFDFGSGTDWREEYAAAEQIAAAEIGWGGSYDERTNTDAMSYEERCQMHVEAFLQAAATAEVQTELAARVAHWQAKISPMLDAQEALDAFDIHLYGANFMQRMASITPAASPAGKAPAAAVGFEALVAEAPPEEVARMFSAMLQLVNSGNLRISVEDAAVGAFSLQLADTTMAYERFHHYRAPAALDKEQQPLNTLQSCPAASPTTDKVKRRKAK